MRRRFSSNKFQASDYLSFISLEDNTTFNFKINNSINDGFVKPMYYNIDGTEWKDYNEENITINKGQVLSIKAGGVRYDGKGNSIISCTSDFEAFGNLSSVGSTYGGLFCNCKYLINASNLKFSTKPLEQRCCKNMFEGCINLKTAPTLPATTLSNSCYRYMFYNCTSLITAPELPATTLAEYCYSNMFEGCTSLTTAPELPATTLANYCYISMFSGCTKLNYIKMLAIDISATRCLNYWVDGVATSGTFVKNPEATWDVVGNSGIPEGWTVKFDEEESGGGENGDFGDLITFEIAEDMMGRNYITYNAYDRMTWNDWIYSEFNIDGYYIDDYDHILIDKVFSLYVLNSSGNAVRTTDYIEAGSRYPIG